MDAAHREIFAQPVSAADRAKLTSVVRDGLPSPSRVGDVLRKDFIDDYLFGRMEANHVPHAGLATDAEFLRRITLDLTGQIPDAQAVREFLKDAGLDKRERLIEALLGSEAYLDYWTYLVRGPLPYRARGLGGRRGSVRPLDSRAAQSQSSLRSNGERKCSPRRARTTRSANPGLTSS
jgi:hypothetical protein